MLLLQGGTFTGYVSNHQYIGRVSELGVTLQDRATSSDVAFLVKENVAIGLTDTGLYLATATELFYLSEELYSGNCSAKLQNISSESTQSIQSITQLVACSNRVYFTNGLNQIICIQEHWPYPRAYSLLQFENIQLLAIDHACLLVYYSDILVKLWHRPLDKFNKLDAVPAVNLTNTAWGEPWYFSYPVGHAESGLEGGCTMTRSYLHVSSAVYRRTGRVPIPLHKNIDPHLPLPLVEDYVISNSDIKQQTDTGLVPAPDTYYTGADSVYIDAHYGMAAPSATGQDMTHVMWLPKSYTSPLFEHALFRLDVSGQLNVSCYTKGTHALLPLDDGETIFTVAIVGTAIRIYKLVNAWFPATEYPPSWEITDPNMGIIWHDIEISVTGAEITLFYIRDDYLYLSHTETDDILMFSIGVAGSISALDPLVGVLAGYEKQRREITRYSHWVTQLKRNPETNELDLAFLYIDEDDFSVTEDAILTNGAWDWGSEDTDITLPMLTQPGGGLLFLDNCFATALAEPMPLPGIIALAVSAYTCALTDTGIIVFSTHMIFLGWIDGAFTSIAMQGSKLAYSSSLGTKTIDLSSSTETAGIVQPQLPSSGAD